MKDRIVSTKEAAERLGVPEQTLRNRIRAGTLPAEKLGREWMIRESDLEPTPARGRGRPRTADPGPSTVRVRRMRERLKGGG